MRQTSPASTKSQVNWTCVAVHRPVGLEAELTLHRLVEQRERAPRSTSAGKDAGLAAPCSETCSDALSARRPRSVSGPSSSMRSTKTRQLSIAATASSEPVPTAGPSWFRSQQSAHSSARARSRQCSQAVGLRIRRGVGPHGRGSRPGACLPLLFPQRQHGTPHGGVLARIPWPAIRV